MYILTQLETLRRRLRDDERGVAAVWFAILALFVFFGFAFFVINLSNTHEHRRHLQLQVDDGALATGSSFTGCFQAPADANKNIAAQALAFAGDPQFATDYAKLFAGAPPPGPFNQQVENATRVRLHLNSQNYATTLADTFDPANGPNNGTDFSLGLPCDTKYLDVKATDVDIPTPFGGLVSTVTSVDVKARSRVEIRKVQALNGLLPWAVPEVKPKAVIAIFVNELSGAVSGAQLLNDAGSTTLNGEAEELWQAAAQFTGHSQSGTGMVVATSSVANPSTSGTLVQICTQTGVKCYSGSSTTSGLWFIDGFTNGTGTKAAPHLGTVTLQNASCGDNSAPYFLLNGDCSVQVRAKVDFGNGGANPTLPPYCASVSVSGGGAMTWSGGTLWTATVTIPDGSGRNALHINWGTQNVNNNKCQGQTTNGSFPETVAAPYAADNASGPVDYVAVFGTPLTPPDGQFLGSLGTSNNSTNSVNVRIGLQPPLRVAATVTEPPILLRIASKSGSLNQALDCDHAPRTLADEVRDGCLTYYQPNTRPNEVCPPWTINNLPPATYVPPSGNLNDAPDCIAVKTGDVTAMAQGLHDRWENPPPPAVACPPNNWPKKVGDPIPDSTDPRWVVLVVTDFTAFSGQGDRVVPITKFAGFYVTGWFQGPGGSLPTGCSTNQAPPNGVLPTAKSVKGDVWGYFVTDVPNLPGATVSNEFCAFNEVGLCLAVLTQ